MDVDVAEIIKALEPLREEFISWQHRDEMGEKVIWDEPFRTSYLHLGDVRAVAGLTGQLERKVLIPTDPPDDLVRALARAYTDLRNVPFSLVTAEKLIPFLYETLIEWAKGQGNERCTDTG